MTTEEMWSRIDEGLPKLWLIRQTLKLRRSRKLLEPENSYRPLVARGEKSDHVVAFARGERAITVVPRLVIKLGGNGPILCSSCPKVAGTTRLRTRR
jgi:(1->4)-alpha-D-glucan 1-alpha-D-glucosylmutase